MGRDRIVESLESTPPCTVDIRHLSLNFVKTERIPSRLIQRETLMVTMWTLRGIPQNFAKQNIMAIDREQLLWPPSK